MGTAATFSDAVLRARLCVDRGRSAGQGRVGVARRRASEAAKEFTNG